MRKVIHTDNINISNSNAPLLLSFEGGGEWLKWNRQIMLGNECIAEIGNVCGTCPYFFNVKKTHLSNWNFRKGDLENKDWKRIANKCKHLIPNEKYSCDVLEICIDEKKAKKNKKSFCKEYGKIWGKANLENLWLRNKAQYVVASAPKYDSSNTFYSEIFVFLEECGKTPKKSKHQENKYDGIPIVIALSFLDRKGNPKKRKKNQHVLLTHYILYGADNLTKAVEDNTPFYALAFMPEKYFALHGVENEGLFEHLDEEMVKREGIKAMELMERHLLKKEGTMTKYFTEIKDKNSLEPTMVALTDKDGNCYDRYCKKIKRKNPQLKPEAHVVVLDVCSDENC